MNDAQLVSHMMNRLQMIDDCMQRIRQNTSTPDQAQSNAAYLVDQLEKLTRYGKDARGMAIAIRETFKNPIDAVAPIPDH